MYYVLKQKLSQKVITPEIGVEVISSIVSRKKVGIKCIHPFLTKYLL